MLSICEMYSDEWVTVIRYVDGKHMDWLFTNPCCCHQEIVALSGAHTLGRCHADRSGFDGYVHQEPLIECDADWSSF